MWRSFAYLGHEVHARRYDDRPHDLHGDLVDEAAALAPDLIIYIGALEGCHDKPVPTIDTLCRLNDIAPMVHLCGDAGDQGWWNMLELYQQRVCFRVQVSMDGSFETPIAAYENCLIALTPIDPSFFHPRVWAERDVTLGSTSQSGHVTGIEGLQRHRSDDYQGMCDYYSRCRIITNHAQTGGGRQQHVKGRVVEAGWAGACLLENVGSPTSRWFEPGVDYLEYSDPASAAAEAQRSDVEMIAAGFRERVTTEHHPSVFWRDVLGLVK